MLTYLLPPLESRTVTVKESSARSTIPPARDFKSDFLGDWNNHKKLFLNGAHEIAPLVTNPDHGVVAGVKITINLHQYESMLVEGTYSPVE